MPVLLAGIESMAEMHSFPGCSNAILMSYSWAWDKFEQAINRIHRINSPKPVQVYSIICRGSIDRRLEEMIHEKSDSAALAIDRELSHDDESEVNLAELLALTRQEFNDRNETVDECILETDWPALRHNLRAAAAQWSALGSAERSESA